MKALKIVAGVVLIFVGICTWSDYYYSKLRRDYPLVLSDTVSIDGVITHYKVHWKYSYITIDSKMKIVIRPTVNENYETKYFNDLIEVGDSIYKAKHSHEIFLKKNGATYKFKNNEPRV